MKNARNTILTKIASKSIIQDDESYSSRRGPQPHWQTEHTSRFLAKLTQAAGTYTILSDKSLLPDALEKYLSTTESPGHVTMAPHPMLRAIAWPQGLQVNYATATAKDVVTMNVAFCGVAETGSLMLVSSPQTPTLLNFLADRFLCVLEKTCIVAHPEDGWDLWRASTNIIPRVVNVITGPSRTADVEQTIQLGAHGPRHLHVFLIG